MPLLNIMVGEPPSTKSYKQFNIIAYQPKSSHNCYLLTIFMPLSLLIPRENIRKPEVFCFQEVSKEISGIKWVKENAFFNYDAILYQGSFI